MITHLDRACIATLAPGIMRDLSLTTVQMGYVFTVFQLAYATFEIPTARWADRTGTRLVLSRIVLWWSCLTAATGAATSYVTLLAIRFLFGCGEAGAWACVARTFSRWIPGRERGTAQGVFFAGAHLVGGLTPALVLWMLQYLVLAPDLRLVRRGGLRVGRRLVHVVPERSVRAPRRQCRRAGDDRQGPRARGRASGGPRGTGARS